MNDTLLKTPRAADIQASIDACLANGRRLLDDALVLEFQENGGARFLLCIVAQEEYAKAFLLYLAREEIIPWDSNLHRILRSHSCKHLVGIVMEYIDPQWDTLDELKKIYEDEYALEGRLPRPVSSALNILYWEIMRRGNFYNDEDEYEPNVVAIARGGRDRAKQNAVYVDIDKSCRPVGPAFISREQAQAEYERAGRYAWIVNDRMSNNAFTGIQMEKLREAVQIVFWQKYRPANEDASVEVSQ